MNAASRIAQDSKRGGAAQQCCTCDRLLAGAEGGRQVREAFSTAVFGPRLLPEYGPFRDGRQVATTDDPLFAEKPFTVPAGDAAYKLTTSVKRSVKVTQASTRADTSGTFRPKKTAEWPQLPASSVRFNRDGGRENKVAAKDGHVPGSCRGLGARP
ncbi:hypothetical protein [Streptomyces spongiae]|uniref:Uncharacterized protein n=1 Tax=Streptomyces spongiae TaxID=565072 RepID=A0A5N8XCT9_9ACTN|nr:hypothetical protein [Streptomyces spongiae]MPY57269.1 hypothetical protein [Streptomyces spongiae]